MGDVVNSAEEERLKPKESAAGPPKIFLDNDALIALSDGTEIQITAGAFPLRPVLNAYIRKVSKNKKRLYRVSVRRPSGERVELNQQGIGVIPSSDKSNSNLKFKSAYSLSPKEKSSLKNLYFIVNDNEEVVSFFRNYDKE